MNLSPNMMFRHWKIARNAASSSRRQSAITSSHIAATSTNSGLARFRACASTATTVPSGTSRRAVSAPMLASMDGPWTRAIRSIGRGEAGRTIWLQPKPRDSVDGPSRRRPPGRVERAAAVVWRSAACRVGDRHCPWAQYDIERAGGRDRHPRLKDHAYRCRSEFSTLSFRKIQRFFVCSCSRGRASSAA